MVRFSNEFYLLNSYTIIFGVTADPIHLGHEQAIINGINYCLKQGLNINQFILMPVYHPHLIVGKRSPSADFNHRFNMCQLVAKRLSKALKFPIIVSAIEKQFSQASGLKNYSYNTVKFISDNQKTINDSQPVSVNTKKKPDSHGLLFMVSADHFQGRWPKFRKWYQWKELLKYTGLLINQRPGHKINLAFISQLKTMNSDIYLVNSEKSIDVSSSQLRNSNHQTRKRKLSKDVFNYILENELYKSL